MADPISRTTYPEQGTDHIPAHFGVTSRRQEAERSVTPAALQGKSFPASMDEATVSAFQAGDLVDTDA